MRTTSTWSRSFLGLEADNLSTKPLKEDLREKARCSRKRLRGYAATYARGLQVFTLPRSFQKGLNDLGLCPKLEF